MARLRSLFSTLPKREAQDVYIALVRQSRKPFFYTDCAVPDSLDGRFEIIVLHIFLKLRALREKGGQEGLSRLLLESFYNDMDRNLREMSVGDMGVARRVKTMAKAVYAHLETYTQVYGDDAALREALKRNVYRGAEVSDAALMSLLGYVRKYNADIL